MLASILKVLALAAVALAIPATDSKDTGNASGISNVPGPSIILCTGPFPNDGCDAFNFPENECVNFKGDLEAYHKTLTGVRVFPGRICFVHKENNCKSAPEDFVILRFGIIYNLDKDLVPNGEGDLISMKGESVAIVCDPVSGD